MAGEVQPVPGCDLACYRTLADMSTPAGLPGRGPRGKSALPDLACCCTLADMSTPAGRGPCGDAPHGFPPPWDWDRGKSALPVRAPVEVCLKAGEVQPVPGCHLACCRTLADMSTPADLTGRDPAESPRSQIVLPVEVGLMAGEVQPVRGWHLACCRTLADWKVGAPRPCSQIVLPVCARSPP
jgi:hypothetical protein